MNICILKESLVIGGTERSAANISKVLDNEHNVFVTLYDASQIKYSYAGKLIDLKLPPKKSLIGKVINTYRREAKLRRLLKSKQIDILYTFTGISNMQTRYKYDVTKIISARDFGGMYEKHEAYKAALNNSSAMICNSEYTKEFYLSKYPEDSNKVFAVYNYIDVDEIQKQSEEIVENEYIEFLKKHKDVLVSVGRFCKEKGFEYLIEAFAKAREKNQELGLVLVGDGEYKQKYMDAIEKLGITSHVYFTGFQKNPYKYMKKCSCFVLSSISEGFPNVVAEAMALGLPVIADNCYSGPAEILRKDKNYQAVTDMYQECDFGILTPRITESDNSNSVLQLSKAIEKLLAGAEKRRYYSEISLKRAEDFSMESTRVKLNNIFNELLKQGGKQND